ncbi:hypothetical protein [Paracidobacterium acidisoli]|uniref:Uncharacterized protein n=1 Tax=Paracidobacterium acidisoli TaxID=2303751 RepID=A0A372INN7_9BACT|nr:hypothetical protein [Paracidobacterium acidisoli]MBT9331846.1 hypothetical protein [Paracidobacterium acidisoli]
MISAGTPLRHSLTLPACILFVAASFALRSRPLRAEASPPHTTLIFYGDPHMKESLWPALFTILQQDLSAREGELAAASMLDPAPEMVRGISFPSGSSARPAIVVRLSGRCDILPQAWSPVYSGPLGWVTELHGVIRPYIYIDCARIVQLLNQRALGMNKEQRRSAMCQAISHILIHEWIHIATQKAAHTSGGIEKANLGIDELITAPASPAAHTSTGR